MTNIAAQMPVLSVENLCIDARTPDGLRQVLEGVSFEVPKAQTLCLAGESGSGKSLTALAIMRLLSNSLRQRSGAIKLNGQDLTKLSDRDMRAMRGGEIAMIFQEPMSSLNPVMTIGAQLIEAFKAHRPSDARDSRKSALAMLDAVHINDASRRMQQYPHELSGGMRQRVIIAMALSCEPKLLIADEPTTALDVTAQAQILRLMRELQREFNTSILMITHDMGVVAEMADRVALLNLGKIVEQGDVADIFNRPRQAYTRHLLEVVPRLGTFSGTDAPPRVTPPAAPGIEHSTDNVLFVKNLRVSYGSGVGLFSGRKSSSDVVKDVSFEIKAGQTLGLVGESGSGKSTTGKAILGLVPFSGDVVIDGTSIAGLDHRAMKPLRREAQMIFQDPYASLDPRMSIGEAIAEPLAIHDIGAKSERGDRVADLLRRVRLSPDVASRYPHEFSGGQRQRICIARALALQPKLIVADESVSALDVSVRVQVLDLLLELQEQMNIALLFISHDMAVVERMSHYVAVMQGGRIVEYGTRRMVFEAAQNPYTKALMEAVPLPEPKPKTQHA